MLKRRSLSRIARNYILASSSRICLLLLLILAGRYLGSEDFGRFSFALAFVFLFDPILDPGLYHVLVRDIARERGSAEKYLSHTLTWKLAVAPLFFGLVAFSANIIHNAPEVLQAVYLLAAASFLKSIKDAFRSTLLGYEEFGLDAISVSIERVALLVVGGWVLASGQGLFALCAVFSLVRVVDLVIIAGMVKYKVCGIGLGYNVAFIKQIVMTSIPIGAFYITLNTYNYVDTVMLSMFKTNVEVGWYNASYRIYEGLLIIPVTIGTVFLPRLSQLYKDHKRTFGDLVSKGIKYIVLLSLFLTANGMIFSDQLITVLFGDAYIESVLTLNILLSGILFVFTVNFLQTVAISMDKQKLICWLALLGLVCNVGLNLWLIPILGHVGAAVSTVVVEAVVFMYLCSSIARIVENVRWWHVIGKPGISLLLPGLMLWWLFSDEGLVLKVGFINAGFLIGLYAMKVCDRAEVEAMWEIVKFRTRVIG